MSYSEFKNAVRAFCATAGGEYRPRLFCSCDSKNYIANIGDIRITGNAVSRVLTVVWDNGHIGIIKIGG